jgi:predicted Fe-S protein YdhL (DUF1289 family)
MCHAMRRCAPSPLYQDLHPGCGGVCTGCLRTLAEIASWTAMTSAEQWQLLAVLEERRKRRLPQPEPGS